MTTAPTAEVPHREVTRGWLLSAVIVLTILVLLAVTLHGPGAGLARTLEEGAPTRSGAGMFGYVLLTNARTVLWCLLGWASAGAASVVVGSLALASLVIAFHVGFGVVDHRPWLVFGVHAAMELLACAAATAAGLFPAVATAVAVRHGSATSPRDVAARYVRHVLRAVPVAAGALALLVLGAAWEAFVAPAVR